MQIKVMCGLYSGINYALGPIAQKSAPLLSADGVVNTDPSQQFERWMKHYCSLYSHDTIVLPEALLSLPHFETLYDFVRSITLSKVKEAISALHNNHSPGVDEIPPKVFKSGGDVCEQRSCTV